MDESEQVPKKRPRLTIWRVFLLLLLIAIIAFAAFRFRLKWKLNTRIKAIRAAGYPVTREELNAWYTIPDDVENAADTFCTAFSFYCEPNKADTESLPLLGRAELPTRTEPLPHEMKAAMARYIADNNETLKLFHAGTKIEHCRYPVDFSADQTDLLAHLGSLKNGIRLLCTEALQHAENGDAEPAIRSIISGFALTHSLAKEPMISSQMVRNTMDCLLVNVFERVATRIEITDEHMVKLTECISRAERERDISRGFVGWQCMFLGFVKDPKSLSTAVISIDLPPLPVLEAYQFLGLADRDAIVHLNIMVDTIEMCKLPIHERYKPALAIDAKQISNSEKHILLWLRIEISDITRADATDIAHLRTARVGLAILRFRQSTGKLPDRLSELVPAYLDAISKDPFDDNALRYKKLKAGFVIYSIGEDLRDDDGKEKPKYSERKSNPNWDVTFIVER